MKASTVLHTLSLLFGFGLICGATYLLWVVATRLLTFLESANPSVSAAIVGAMATVLVGIGGALYTQSQIKRREVEESHRARKVEIYKGFLDMVARMISDGNESVSNKAPSQQELVDFLIEFKTNVILWGSPKVINAQLNFQKVSLEEGNVLEAVGQLYKAIREDIGLSNRGLDKNQLVKMYLRNPDEFDEKSSSNKVLHRTSH